MVAKGELNKMLILAFADSEACENGGEGDAEAKYTALINPETYTHEFKLKFSDDAQGQGTSGQQLKYEYTAPEEMTFEFLFDNTGIIDGQPKDEVATELAEFKRILVEYQGDTHEPRHFKLVWGEHSIFKGRVTELAITYKLFRPDGTPTRAVAKVKFKASIEDVKRAAQEDKSSPDLTHVHLVVAGDNLPLLCYRFYGDPGYALAVARFNRLDNPRELVPNTRLRFPPLEDKDDEEEEA
jgi:hypothetical protein